MDRHDRRSRGGAEESEDAVSDPTASTPSPSPEGGGGGSRPSGATSVNFEADPLKNFRISPAEAAVTPTSITRVLGLDRNGDLMAVSNNRLVVVSSKTGVVSAPISQSSGVADALYQAIDCEASKRYVYTDLIEADDLVAVFSVAYDGSSPVELSRGLEIATRDRPYISRIVGDKVIFSVNDDEPGIRFYSVSCSGGDLKDLSKPVAEQLDLQTTVVQMSDGKVYAEALCKELGRMCLAEYVDNSMRPTNSRIGGRFSFGAKGFAAGILDGRLLIFSGGNSLPVDVFGASALIRGFVWDASGRYLVAFVTEDLVDKMRVYDVTTSTLLDYGEAKLDDLRGNVAATSDGKIVRLVRLAGVDGSWSVVLHQSNASAIILAEGAKGGNLVVDPVDEVAFFQKADGTKNSLHSVDLNTKRTSLVAAAFVQSPFVDTTGKYVYFMGPFDRRRQSDLWRSRYDGSGATDMSQLDGAFCGYIPAFTQVDGTQTIFYPHAAPGVAPCSLKLVDTAAKKEVVVQGAQPLLIAESVRISKIDGQPNIYFTGKFSSPFAEDLYAYDAQTRRLKSGYKPTSGEQAAYSFGHRPRMTVQTKAEVRAAAWSTDLELLQERVVLGAEGSIAWYGPHWLKSGNFVIGRFLDEDVKAERYLSTVAVAGSAKSSPDGVDVTATSEANDGSFLVFAGSENSKKSLYLIDGNETSKVSGRNAGGSDALLGTWSVDRKSSDVIYSEDDGSGFSFYAYSPVVKTNQLVASAADNVTQIFGTTEGIVLFSSEGVFLHTGGGSRRKIAEAPEVPITPRSKILKSTDYIAYIVQTTPVAKFVRINLKNFSKTTVDLAERVCQLGNLTAEGQVLFMTGETCKGLTVIDLQGGSRTKSFSDETMFMTYQLLAGGKVLLQATEKNYARNKLDLWDSATDQLTTLVKVPEDRKIQQVTVDSLGEAVFFTANSVDINIFAVYRVDLPK